MKEENVGNQVMNWIGIVLLGAVGIGVFTFSASNNFNLFVGIFGATFWGYVLSVFGLTLLDIGAVGWIIFGVSSAKGIFQRITAWLTGAICLVLALSAAVSELIIVQQYVERPDWIGNLAIGAIVVGLIVNSIAIALTHVISPDTMLAIKVGMKKDTHKQKMSAMYLAVLDESIVKAAGKMKEASDYISTQIATELHDDGVHELLGYTPNGDNSGASRPRMQLGYGAMGGGQSPDLPAPRSAPRPMPRTTAQGEVSASTDYDPSNNVDDLETEAPEFTPAPKVMGAYPEPHPTKMPRRMMDSNTAQ